MIKKILSLTAALSLVLASSVVSASEIESTVEFRAASDLIYRGQELTSSEGTVGVGFLFDNVVLDGVYVSGDFDTLEFTPVTDNVRVRTDFEVGYGSVWNNFVYSASLARVLNPVAYPEDYTEFRLRGQYSYFYGEIGQGLTDNVNTDTYFSVGVEGPVFVEQLLVGASTSFVSYDGDPFGPSNVEWNNLQVYANYNVWRELDINAGYSFGGDKPSVGLDDHAWVGVSYTF
jgi:hypothetical protein